MSVDLNPKQWLNDYGSYLFKYAIHRVSDTEVAEDLVQETFLAGIKGRENFKRKSTEKTWLTSILKFKIIDHYRKKNREIPLSKISESSDIESALFDKKGHRLSAASSWGTNPEKHIENAEFMQVLNKCVGKLPSNLSSVFKMKMFEEHESTYICKELQISPNNLWVILHRARLKLKKCISTNWFEK
ncbi:MAG: sigma-70 family RNA polymerase sigma factor [Candidatus Cloacimonetes bacterium]|nr:sigma-70 family RNA polymerase sigma factor [Candidatus Cloacimonadota bacterium]